MDSTKAGNKSVCPDADDIEAMYKSINCEINQVIFDNSLQYEVAKNVEKAIGLFTAKVEGEKIYLEYMMDEEFTWYYFREYQSVSSYQPDNFLSE